MKREKRISKKLNFKKADITSLSIKEKNDIKGGYPTAPILCIPSWKPQLCAETAITYLLHVMHKEFV